MSDYLTGMVYDRTSADVAAKNKKGIWNASDLNRVEEAIQYVGAAIGISVSTRSWSFGESVTFGKLSATVADEQNLRDHWLVASDCPATPSLVSWNYASANALERVLSDMKDFIISKEEDKVYAGQIYSGGGRVLQ